MSSRESKGSLFQQAGAADTDRRDRLQYLADMLLELQAMAEREGCTTLAGLLALSQSEASLQAKGLGRISCSGSNA